MPAYHSQMWEILRQRMQYRWSYRCAQQSHESADVIRGNRLVGLVAAASRHHDFSELLVSL
jgi:hypothetical protein